MYQGGCLCGVVRFEIHGPIRNIVYCHCSQCRKVQGSAFATNGIVNTDDFHVTCGSTELGKYEENPGQAKYFCCHCASPILSKNEACPGQVRVRLGTIETDIKERPVAHIYVSSKANWETIPDDGLPRYNEHEPGR